MKRLGRFDQAVAILKKITHGIDSADAAKDTSLIVSRAFYELGLIYQKKMSNYKDARKFLVLASKTKDTLYSHLAASRLTAMEELEKLRNNKKEPKNSRFFKIAELFRFELDEPDSAFNQFISLSRDTGVETGLVPKALCAAAMIARDEKQDTTVADSIFKLVIKNYPSSEFARLAQKETGVAVTVKTREDSAKEAFRIAEDLAYEEQDIKGSIHAFFEIYKNYPDQAIAPKALYTAAWLSDDVLQKNRTAKALYEKICEKYPESVYCKDMARPKIDLVIDTMKALGMQITKEESRLAEPLKTAKKGDSKSKKENKKSAPELKNVSVQDSIDTRNAIEDSNEPLTADEMDENQRNMNSSTDSIPAVSDPPDTLEGFTPALTTDSSSVPQK